MYTHSVKSHVQTGTWAGKHTAPLHKTL